MRFLFLPSPHTKRWSGRQNAQQQSDVGEVARKC